MKILKQKYRPIARIQQIPQLFYLIKWTVLSVHWLRLGIAVGIIAMGYRVS